MGFGFSDLIDLGFEFRDLTVQASDFRLSLGFDFRSLGPARETEELNFTPPTEEDVVLCRRSVSELRGPAG